jgi:antitoxin CcdA
MRVKYAHSSPTRKIAMLRFDNAPKKATNLSLNSKVLEVARELGMNLSQTVDALLAKEVERLYWEQWGERNKEAIEHYNERIRRDGIWGAKYRTFARSLGDGRVAEEAVSKKKTA